MSLATLARKTKAKQRLKTRGNFILNMTGRGNVLGMNAKMSRGNCKGLTKCAGKRAACCVGVGGDEPGCCRFPHGGKPAPQMGYRVYLNRKSKGAYRPAGGKQCKDITGCTKAKTVWKQGSNLDASVVTTNRKDNVLACNSDVYTAKRDTCTGCVNDPTTNTMTVRDGSGVPNELLIGYNGPPGTQFGTYTPDNIVTSNGTLALELAEFSAWTGPGAVPAGISFGDLFVIFTAPNNGNAKFTIAFVDCDDGTYQVFNTKDAIFAANNTAGMGGAAAGTYTAFIWGNTAAYGGAGVGLNNPGTSLPIFTVNSGGAYVSWASMEAWWASKLTKSLKVITVPNEGGISLDTISVMCGCRCCPVKKNICGCRATDLLRYTRINKSFGCQTTKAVRMGRSASEQIARRRAAVDCIKPTHKNIYMTTGASTANFKGCCGNQCLIEGHRYTFHFEALIDTNYPIYIEWCPGLREIVAGKLNGGDTAATTLTVPAVNCSTPGRGFAKLQVATGPGGTGIVDIGLTFEYCKEAFKRPQMLGSCSGR